VTEISGMQSGKLSSENILCLELNKHLLHIIETARLNTKGPFYNQSIIRRKDFLVKNCEWALNRSSNYQLSNGHTNAIKKI
jgi:hypothetical protein